MEMQNVEPADPKRRQARLKRAAGLCGIKAPGLHVAIELGGKDASCGPAAALGNGCADPLLAAAESVEARGVDEAILEIEDGIDRCPRPAGLDVVAVGFGHPAEPGCPEADGRHADSGVSEKPPLQFHPSILLVLGAIRS